MKSAASVHTGQVSRLGGGRTVLYRRSIDRPAPTLTGQTRCWWVRSDGNA